MWKVASMILALLESITRFLTNGFAIANASMSRGEVASTPSQISTNSAGIGPGRGDSAEIYDQVKRGPSEDCGQDRVRRGMGFARGRLLLGLLIAVVGLVVFATRKEIVRSSLAIRWYHEAMDADYTMRGWQLCHRWRGGPLESSYGQTVFWYAETGFIARLTIPTRGTTYFYPDGRVEKQLTSGKPILNPPWLWGVENQVNPSMPEWMLDGENWRTLLELQSASVERSLLPGLFER